VTWLQGWLLGTWIAGLKDSKATMQQVLGYLEDGIIVPESGMHDYHVVHIYTCMASMSSHKQSHGLCCMIQCKEAHVGVVLTKAGGHLLSV